MLAMSRTDSEALDRLETDGYALLSCEPIAEALTAAALDIGRSIGAVSVGIHLLGDDAAPQYMLRHTETITMDEDAILGYFALGCIQAARSGGHTRIYDARAAARNLLAADPALADARIYYFSTTYPNQSAVHPLVAQDATYGPVLRYRSQTRTNTVVELPHGHSEASMYAAAETALDKALVLDHTWQPGELLVVNNRLTVHDRTPYEGDRQMIRYRYDDPHYRTEMIR
jgi:alpha-ketoglutarate-dependent taurine dioxygenase